MKSKILLLSFFPILSANAASVAYYKFDDGTSGAASTLANATATPGLNGTASGNGGGAAPTFNASTPGSVIIDGVGGATLNSSNTSSLEFANTGGTHIETGNLNTTTGGIVNVPGTSALQSTSFTMEGFVKLDSIVEFATLFSKIRSGTTGGQVTWQLDFNGGSGALRARFDSQASGTSGSGSGWNQGVNTTAGGNINDGLWHHVALTYDGSTRDIRILVDYVDVTSGTPKATNALVYDNSNVTIGAGGGGRAFDGFIDEVRYSDSVLATDAFLRAVPETSTSLLSLGSLALFLLRRKRI